MHTFCFKWTNLQLGRIYKREVLQGKSLIRQSIPNTIHIFGLDYTLHHPFPKKKALLEGSEGKKEMESSNHRKALLDLVVVADNMVCHYLLG